MAITALPTPPSRSSDTPAQFSTKADALLGALPTFVTEANDTAAALNLNATNDTSSSSVAIGTGAKTFTVTAGKSFQPGMYLVIADTAAPSTNSMIGQITSYSGTTLVMNIVSITGSGTKTAWTISQSAYLPATAGDHIVTVHTGNGHGSTNTRIRRFTTTLVSTGTAITYADSATLGATFTINEAGLYEVYYADISSAGATSIGVTLNSAELTTNVQSTAIASRVAVGLSGPSATEPGTPLTRTVRLAAADVIRAHTNSNPNGTTSLVYFSIRKTGN